MMVRWLPTKSPKGVLLGAGFSVLLIGLGVQGCRGRSSIPGDSDAEESLLTSAGSCRIDLTKVLQKGPTGDWVVSWKDIDQHVGALKYVQGERSHRMRPSAGSNVVASIDAIKGTENLDADWIRGALRCGRVIMRIESDGDHKKLKQGMNHLV